MKRTSISCGIFALWLFSTLAFQACKTDEELGFEVQPPEDKIIVGFDDSAGITAYSVREDSVKADETILNLLGSTNDPIFGNTSAGFYVQFRLPDNNVDFGSNPQIDSIVLAMAYNSYYGDLSTSQTVKVYEISEDFFLDSSYFSHQRLQCFSTPLASKTFFPKPNDSASADGIMWGPNLQIKLDNSLGQKFMDASGTSSLADNDAFVAFFKGLYVVADPVMLNGAILYFNLLTTPTRLKVYYHNDDSDSLNYNFVINENSARFNTFEHFGYSGANHDFQHQIAGDTARGAQKLFLQSMGGVKTFIKIPDIIDLLPEGGVVINKAELVIPINPEDNENYARPAQLTLVKIETDGTLSFIVDELYGSTYFGGTYNGTTGEYRFNLATYIQNAALNSSNLGKGLYLAISGASIKGDRVVLNGVAGGENNLRLEITYTRIH